MHVRGKLLALLVPCVSAPLLAVGWLGFSQLRESSELHASRGAEALLTQVAARATSHRASVEADVALFANSSRVRGYLLIPDERDRYMLHLEGLLAQFASYQQARPEYYEIRLLLPDGYEDVRATAASLANATDEEGDTAYFRLLRDSPQEIVSRVRINPDNGRPALYVSKRIALADTARTGSSARPVLRGYLVVTSSLDFLADRATLADGTVLFFTDAQGTQLSIGADGGSRRFPARVLRDGLDALGKSRRIVVGDRSYLIEGRAVSPDLLIFAVSPTDKLDAAAVRLALTVALVTLLAIALTAALLYRAVAALLLEPLGKLGAAARAVGQGQLVKDVGIRRGDEIGELARRFEEMSENLRQSGEKAQFLAYHDSLTGLPNRRLFLEQLEHSLARARRRGNCLALLFLDVDDFKRVNDTLGHQAGDELLTGIAERMVSTIRGEDWVATASVWPARADDQDDNIVARLGGDEFILLLPELDEPVAAATVARRVLASLTQPFTLQGQEFHVGASIGITVFPRDGDTADTLVRNGDVAMYHAKSRGKHNFQFFDAGMNQAAVERVATENALRRAIEQDQLVLHYQPQFNLASGTLEAFEALVRWQHPERGLTMPGTFIPVAEESGLIQQVGEWVLGEACRQSREWFDERLPRVRMSVNVSNAQFKRPEFRATVERIVAETGADPRCLELELTETSVMDSEERSAAILSRLKALGITVAMDDFGTGYSSLAALRRLPLDVLKIDRSFVRDIEHDPDDDTIVAAIVSMGRTLGLRLVAEGVETGTQLERLRACGCHVAQGYLLGRPMPAQEARSLLRRHATGVVNLASAS